MRMHVTCLYIVKVGVKVAAVVLPLMASLSGCTLRTGSAVQGSTTSFAQDFDSVTSSYKLSYSYQLSSNPSNLDFIELREVDSTVYPSANVSTCTVGIPVRTWNSPFEANQSIAGFYLAGSQNKFRYVLCLWSKTGTVTAVTDTTASSAASAAASATGVSQQSVSTSSTTYTATKVTSGQYFSCALFSNGRVKCWGNNSWGQLGRGNTTNMGDGANEMGSNLANIDLGTSSATALSAIDIGAGLRHACALFSSGKVKCWGANNRGQLGLGNTTSRGLTANQMGDNLPYVDLGTNLTAKSLAVGGEFTCAVLSNNTVKCWGENSSGQLGRGNSTVVGGSPNQMGDNLAAINLGTGRTVKTVAAGIEHVCAILDTNQVKCWGLNDIGQLGLSHANNVGDASNEMGDNLRTVKFGSSSGGYSSYASMISLGTSHTCVTDLFYRVKCWGDNASGQLGRGSTKASLGDSSDDMKDDDDDDDSWDSDWDDNDGRGHGNKDDKDDDHHPRYVFFGSNYSSYLQPVVKLQVGYLTTCAQLWTSEIKCWGDNTFGQLGIGSTTTKGTSSKHMGNNLSAVNIGSSAYVKSMSSQYGTMCVITQDSVVKCWGINTNGALGYGDTTNRGGSSSHMGSNLPIVEL